MRRRALLTAALVLLIGCSREDSPVDKHLSPEPEKGPETTHVSSTETSAATEIAKESSPRSFDPSPTQLTAPVPSISNDPAPPAGSAQALALAQLDRQAKDELDGGVLSPTTQLHAQFKSENRQEDWASFVEENLKRHFLNKKFSNVDVAQIGCKTNICELLAVARDAASAPKALETWQMELFSLRREQWWQYAQMSNPSFQVSSTKDGRSLFVTHLMRKPMAVEPSRSAP